MASKDRIVTELDRNLDSYKNMPGGKEEHTNT